MRNRYQVIVATLLVCAFSAGLLTAPRPAQALDIKGLLKTGVLLFGVSWVVRQYGEQINGAINDVLRQHDAEIKGATKVVPIFRLAAGGVGGTAVGAAQVMGPPDQVKKVSYVLEVEPLGGSLRVRGLIPLETKEGITRDVKGVSGVGVSANIKFPV